MKRFFVFALLAAMTALGTEVASVSSTSDQTAAVTFNKDILPILEKNCQGCHQPGAAAPMSFLTYESTRPWAKAMKAAVLNKQMPPWFADPHYGEFRNAPKLTESDAHMIATWADTGANEGNSADKPPVQSPQYDYGWRIQPDVVISMPQAFHVPAKGAGEIRSFIVENPFK